MIHQFTRGGHHFALDVHSGAVHLIDEVTAAVLSHHDGKDLQNREELIGRYGEDLLTEAEEEVGMLIAEGLLFSKDGMPVEKINAHQPVVKALCLHVAHDCNLRCTYCFASQGDFEGDRLLMPLDVGKRALEFLVENSGNRRNLEVDFFGGEPLMNFDVVKELVAYGRSLERGTNKRFRFTLTTNGVLLDDEIIAFLNEEMHNVVLSLDGDRAINDRMRPTTNGRGSYDLIVPKFKQLVEARGGRDYYVRGTFTHFNADFTEDVLHLHDLGFNETSVEPVVAEPHHDYALRESDLETVKAAYDRLAEAMLERRRAGRPFHFFHYAIDLDQGPCAVKRVSGCGAGTEYLAITPEGEIYPCHQFVGKPEFKMGSVMDEPVSIEPTHDFAAAHVYHKPTCKACWAKFYCSGGCHANAYNFNGNLTEPYALGCEMEKHRIENAIYLKAMEMLEE